MSFITRKPTKTELLQEQVQYLQDRRGELHTAWRQQIELNLAMSQQLASCRKALEEAITDSEGRLRTLKTILTDTEKVLRQVPTINFPTNAESN